MTTLFMEDHIMARQAKIKARETAPMTQRTITAEPRPVSAEQIRNRAYELYLARGRGPGDPVQDWLQAETELRTRPARR